MKSTKTMNFFSITFIILLHSYQCKSVEYVTQTVYGFLDFTTTIGNTVMLFSPQSIAPIESIKSPNNVIKTKPYKESKISINNNNTLEEIQPTKLAVSSKYSTFEQTDDGEDTKNIITVAKNITLNSLSDTQTYDATLSTAVSAVSFENNVLSPEYDLLSREPAEYAEETYRVVSNFKSNTRNRPSTKTTKLSNGLKASEGRPVGFITKLSETEVRDGVATIHETSVLGTYISGKYAQVLQSASNSKSKVSYIRPTSSHRVLKTSAPASSKGYLKSMTRQSSSIGKFRKNQSPVESAVVINVKPSLSSEGQPKKGHKKSKRRHKSSRTSSKNIQTHTPINDHEVRRSFRTKVQPSITEADSTSLYMFKLNRTPGRWQYKSSPKPRVTIRKSANDNVPQSAAPNNLTIVTSENIALDQRDLESSGSQSGPVINKVENQNKPALFVETLNVEISTPADLGDTYYEIATIRSPYTFQAGVVKKTRFVTVTSTFEKSLEPDTSTIPLNDEPLTENILATSTKAEEGFVDGGITTLKPITITDSGNTPSLETITTSFTISQRLLRTQILPIVAENGSISTSYTLLQTYDVTSLITATKTISPLQESQFEPSKSFKDFDSILDEAGSEVNLELEFGDEDNFENIGNTYQNKNSHNNDSDNFDSFSSSIISQNNKNIQLVPSQTILNSINQFSTVITTTIPVTKKEIVWESHVVPVTNGLSTSYRTLSKSIGVIEKTEYIVDTTTYSLPPPPPSPSINPFLLPIPPHYQTLTSSLVHQTIATQVNSKVLKLTFGARTAYTTIFSTEVRPTIVTEVITTAFPLQPTAAFPGYYPPPYHPYPYLG